MQSYTHLTVVELKGLLKSHGLKVSGKKSELIERLIESSVPPPTREIQRYQIQSKIKTFSLEKQIFRSPSHHIEFYSRLFEEKELSLSIYQSIFDGLFLKEDGSTIPPPTGRRYNQTYGNEGLVYKITFGAYGGGKPGNTVERRARMWTEIPILSKLRDIVQKLTSSEYTYCVVQYYPSGKVGINPHRDKEMTEGSVIAGLSVGQNRTLRMSRNGKNIDLDLLSGSLYVLYPPTNDYWTHSILKDDSTHPRISLTFRTLI